MGGRSGDGVEMLREYLWDFHGIVTGIYRICSRSYWIYSWDPYISLWDTILYIGYLIKPTWDTSECCGDVKGIWNFMEFYGISWNITESYVYLCVSMSIYVYSLYLVSIFIQYTYRYIYIYT